MQVQILPLHTLYRKGDMSEIKLDVWKCGYPVWCIFKYKDQEIKLRHYELHDLLHKVKVAIREARNGLPENYKQEMDY